MSLSGPFNFASGGFLAASLVSASSVAQSSPENSEKVCGLESCLGGMGDKNTSIPRSPTEPCSASELTLQPGWEGSLRENGYMYMYG